MDCFVGGGGSNTVTISPSCNLVSTNTCQGAAHNKWWSQCWDRSDGSDNNDGGRGELWDRAMEEGRCFGAVHQGLWFDVGTPQSIQLTETALENV